MDRKYFVAALFFISQLISAQSNMISIIPKPTSININDGFCETENNTKLFFDAKQIPNRFINNLSREFKYRTGLEITADSIIDKQAKGVFLFIDNSIEKQEGYKLTINKNSITLFASDLSGLYYAFQSLLQLFPLERKFSYLLPCLEIEDAPRFKWRGVHLDVCRHFFPIEFIKKYIDILAIYKINTFHWHLTEDQGWRIEIKKYPKLIEIGSNRKETMGDGIPHGGYYTQDQIREVVKYAKEKFITVVPEIEMPGHALAALTSYPEFSCTGGPFDVETKWGVFKDVFCAGNDSTFKFLENILDEVIELFPSEYIHIGGDEVPKDRWKNCSKCQSRMTNEKLKDEHELQSYFIHRIEKYLNSKGKKIIGWDEILEGGLAPNAAVMSWRGTDGGIAAAKMKHNVVMSPGTHCYFDHYQWQSGEPKAIGGFTPLEKVYSYDPVPSQLNDNESKFILGAQANMWAEYFETTDHVEYMLLPRLLALSEVVWSSNESKDISDFLNRIKYHYTLLEKLNYNFRIPPPIKTGNEILVSSGDFITFDQPIENSKIFYTTDGSDPTKNSLQYFSPISVSKEFTIKAKTFLENGRTSPLSIADVRLIDTTENGLFYKYYEGEWTSLPKFAELRPIKNGRVHSLSLQSVKNSEDYFGIFFYGFIEIENDGNHTFYLSSDDGSKLSINNQIIIDNDGLHGNVVKSGNVKLTSGRHPFIILYFENSGNQSLSVEYEGPGINRKPIPANKLYFNP